MVAYTMPQHRRKEESEQLRGKRDKINTLYIYSGCSFTGLFIEVKLGKGLALAA